MAENDRKEQVIGVAFDGTGYGTDGTIWGGELLLADYHGFERMGSIEPFLQIGGDISAKEGWRIAVSLIYQQTQDKAQTMESVKKLNLCSEPECKVLLAMADRKMNAVLSTSAGRLFDAVSAILGIRTKSTFEGEASMALEFAAEAYEKEMWEIDEPAEGENSSDEEKKGPEDRLIMKTGSLIKYLTEKKTEGIQAEKLAYIFHQKLADLIICGCRQIRKKTKCNCVALSGGVFQNRLLLRMVEEGLEKAHFTVLRHHLIPANDGGIALGQAAYAMQYIQEGK